MRAMRWHPAVAPHPRCGPDVAPCLRDRRSRSRSTISGADRPRGSGWPHDTRSCSAWVPTRAIRRSPPRWLMPGRRSATPVTTIRTSLHRLGERWRGGSRRWRSFRHAVARCPHNGVTDGGRSMTERILLIGDDDTLKPISSAPYVKEDVSQSLLERYPDLKRSCREDFGNPWHHTC